MRFLIGLLFFFLSNNLFAQYIPVGLIGGDDMLRTLQLIGKIEQKQSLSARPFFLSKNTSINKFYRMVDSTSDILLPTFNTRNNSFSLQVFPIIYNGQFNSHHPFGGNDGSLINANGFQSQITGGVYLKAGLLELQLQPELVYALNNNFIATEKFGYNTGMPYKKIFPGQSSIGITLGNFTAGVSTANLWWGPGVHNAIVMSNNAPGFPHVYFKNKYPINTPVGYLEFQILGGKLTSDTTLPFENNHLRLNNQIVKNDWRYINAFVFTYQPRWINGLFLGMTRSLQRYNDDLSRSSSSFFDKYLKILALPIQKKNNPNDNSLNTDQLASVFFRWIFPKSRSEIYVEFAKNDYSYNIREYVLEPSQAAAHTVGFKKVKELNNHKLLAIGFELTQTSESPVAILRYDYNWYIHTPIKQGYTNHNQIMGVGSGFASNKQTLTINVIRGFNNLGFIAERIERDPEYNKYKWTDISLGVKQQLKHKNLLFSGHLQMVYSKNYSWEKDLNTVNLFAKASLLYFFNKNK